MFLGMFVEILSTYGFGNIKGIYYSTIYINIKTLSLLIYLRSFPYLGNMFPYIICRFSRLHVVNVIANITQCTYVDKYAIVELKY